MTDPKDTPIADEPSATDNDGALAMTTDARRAQDEQPLAAPERDEIRSLDGVAEPWGMHEVAALAAWLATFPPSSAL